MACSKIIVSSKQFKKQTHKNFLHLSPSSRYPRAFQGEMSHRLEKFLQSVPQTIWWPKVINQKEPLPKTCNIMPTTHLITKRTIEENGKKWYPFLRYYKLATVRRSTCFLLFLQALTQTVQKTSLTDTQYLYYSNSISSTKYPSMSNMSLKPTHWHWCRFFFQVSQKC